MTVLFVLGRGEPIADARCQSCDNCTDSNAAVDVAKSIQAALRQFEDECLQSWVDASKMKIMFRSTLNKLILETKCDFSELTEDLLRTFVVLGIFQVMINSMLQQHVAVDECCAPDSGD